MSLVTRTAPLAIIGALALPAAASAQGTHHHSKPTAASVRVHVRNADHALSHMRALVRHHRSAQAAAALKLARHETAVASRAARGLALNARTAGQASVAAGALGQVAVQYNLDLSSFASMLDQVSSTVQQSLAQALQPALAGRQMALGMLGSMLSMVPNVQLPTLGLPLLSSTGDITSQVQNLAGTLGAGLPEDITQLISQTIAQVTGLLSANLQMIQSLIPSLPTDAQGAYSTGIDTAVASLGDVSSIINQVMGIVNSTMGQVSTIIGTQLNQVMSMVQSILGQFTGGTTAGGFQFPLPSFISSMLGGLFGGQTTGTAGGSLGLSGLLSFAL